MGIHHFIGIILFTFGIATSAMPLEEQWSDTNFSYKEIDPLINDKNCQGHPRQVYGCTDALQALLNTIPKNELHIVRPTAIIFYRPFVTLVKDLGDVHLVKVDSAKMVEGLDPEKALQKVRTYNKFLEKEMIRSQIIKFNYIYSEIKKMVPPNLEKAASAAALNAYNSNVLGPRNYYVPTKVRQLPAKPSVSTQIIDQNLYIKVTGFTNGTCVAFKAALRSAPSARAVIVDLRSNGGGQIVEMSCMLSPFIGEGATTMEFTNPVTFKLESVASAPKPEFMDLRPIIVITNTSSASASEAFAGAIQDYGIGFTVGLRTYGKGTAQKDILDTKYKNTVFVKTTTRYNLPSGRSPQVVGVKPDFEAYLNLTPSMSERHPLFENDNNRFTLPKAKDYGYNHHTQIDKVKSCVSTNAKATVRFKKEGDYQLLVARDVADCAALYGR